MINKNNLTILIKNNIPKKQILKFTKGKSVTEIDPHEVGSIGESIAEKLILKKIKGVHNVQSLKDIELNGICGVPFDKIARYYHNTVWLVEVKTMIKKFGYTPGITQKKRMKEVLKRLKQKGKEIQPILIQIRLGTGDYIVRYFNTEHKEHKIAPTFDIIIKNILDYDEKTRHYKNNDETYR